MQIEPMAVLPKADVPTFENFSRQSLSTEKLVNEEGAAHNFLVYSPDYYDSEKARRDAVVPLLGTLLRREFGDFRNPDEHLRRGRRIFYCTILWNSVSPLQVRERDLGWGW